MYILTVTPEQLAALEDHFPNIAATAKRKPVRKAPEPVEVFAPDTGDAALDAFMIAHHDPKWKAPKITDGEPWGIYRARGGDRRALRIVLAEAITTARVNGWPGTYDIIGTKVEAA